MNKEVTQRLSRMHLTQLMLLLTLLTMRSVHHLLEHQVLLKQGTHDKQISLHPCDLCDSPQLPPTLIVPEAQTISAGINESPAPMQPSVKDELHHPRRGPPQRPQDIIERYFIESNPMQVETVFFLL